MATATTRMATPAGMRQSNDSAGVNVVASTPAVESAVDAYAARVLRIKSPPEACIDPSLGPYVTSILRCALAENAAHGGTATGELDADDIPEFESLSELLEEHCSMSAEVARCALQCIVNAVRTGVIESLFDDQASLRSGSLNSMNSGVGNIINIGGSSFGSRFSGRSYRSHSVGSENDDLAINLLGNMLKDADIQQANVIAEGQVNESPLGSGSGCDDPPRFLLDEEQFPQRPNYQDSRAIMDTKVSYQETSDCNFPCEAGTNGIAATSLKPDRLIPVDLLGDLDDPSTPAAVSRNDISEKPVEMKKADTLPKDSTALLASKRSHTGKGRKKSKAQASDLAAALFRPSRSRSNSTISEKKSPKLRPLAGPPPGLLGSSLSSSPQVQSLGMSALLQQQMDSATQILMSMNVDLGEEAAAEAALVSNADVNVAQYVLDGAMTAPPVCRHMLNNACYRSDCQFSHDVEGHTCLFWLRGRCGKGTSCRFLHGFSEKLLDGIKTDFLPKHHRAEERPETSSPCKTQPILIKTTNLVEHNMKAPYISHNRDSQFSSSYDSPYDLQLPAAGAFGMSSSPFSLSHLAGGSPSNTSILESAMQPPKTLGNTEEPEKQPEMNTNSDDTSSSFSFANVAAKKCINKSLSASNDGVFRNSGGIAGALGATLNTHSAPLRRSESSNLKVKTVKIPQNLWNASQNRDSSSFHISDPLQRYYEVSACQPRHDVIDLHFQSLKTFPVVLSAILPEKFLDHKEVWVVTGSGHHVGQSTHQKGGGVLENAVLSWLSGQAYEFYRGKDRNGYSGAVLVKRR